MDKQSQAIVRKEAEIFKAMSHEKRIQTIRFLCRGERSALELLEHLKISKANLSQHMAILKSTGLVTSKKDGINIFYKLSSKNISEACKKMNDVVLGIIAREAKLLK